MVKGFSVVGEKVVREMCLILVFHWDALMVQSKQGFSTLHERVKKFGR